jgi:rfaE bifunctional protein nucleotidyltransferase chain/domain
MSNQKVVSIDELERISALRKAAGDKLVLCHGVFDLMHSGHIFHLQRAKREGDVLVVTITANSFVNKGPGRPVFSEELRAETIAALACVDYVAINNGPMAIDIISRLKPDVYVKGGEYRNPSDDLTRGIEKELAAIESVGGRIFFTDEATFSSSTLLNEHFGIFPPETKSFLNDFRLRHSSKDVIESLQSLSRLKVLVIGDAIVDQYHYTSPLGQSGKSLALCVKHEYAEQFAGGAIAVANHVAGFCDSVTLVSALGKLHSHEEFIRSKLKANVSPRFFFLDDAPTVTKRRFVDEDLNKMFEVYFFNEEPNLEKIEIDVNSWLSDEAGNYDLVIVPDFGNGFISEKIAESLCSHSRFLAVNTQINSGNRGYHVVNRYPRADFISLNEPEMRLAAHDRHSPLETLIEKIGARLGAKSVAVTRGTKGAVFVDRSGPASFNVPALSTKVVDRIGAGDAFLSLSSLCLGGGLSPEVAGFVGSAAAALDVQIVCNREPIAPTALYKYITTLLR